MKLIDDFLNNITMYRLVLYYLLVLIFSAVVLSFFNLLPFGPISLILTTSFILAIGWLTNKVFAYVFKAPTNVESIYISALILALIITPLKNIHDLPLIFWSAVFIAASKFIFAIRKKHVFNPVAFSVLIISLASIGSASWWVGTLVMMPQVLIGGLLIVKKIRRFSLVLSYLMVAISTILVFSLIRGNDLSTLIRQVFLDSPILFFAFVMLTEPQTTPPTKTLQVFYGGLVGLLFVPLIHVGNFYFTPEISLLIGNVFSYLVSPKEKLLLVLKEKLQIANDTYDFVFNSDRKLAFLPGQYMEWTLGHKNPDSRGNRRYFTLASSPTEGNLRIGVKFYPQSSSFKKALLSLDSTQSIVVSQLSGEFTLPKDANQKLCFVAGGIGITPYRSIIKYLIDTNQKRDIILLYSNKTASDIAYKDVFDVGLQTLGIRTVYTLTDKTSIPLGWQGRVGYIDAQVMQQEVSDYRDRVFYISGPHSMVDVFEKTLKDMGITGKQIKVDYFPGYV